MKIHLISDIHIEMDPKLILSAPHGTDLIVLAGDIANGTDAIEWIQRCYGTEIDIIYIAGNHEFYFNDMSVTNDITELTSGTNIHFLDNQIKIINDVRFIGTTLWTSFDNWGDEKGINRLHGVMNDYNYVKATDFYADPVLVERAIRIRKESLGSLGAQKGLLVPVITYIKHLDAVKFLNKELAKPYDGKTVVVTHHAPSYSSVNPSKEEYKHAYASSLEHLIAKHSGSIDAWFHGHLHVPVNYMISGVPIISNPRNYPMFAWNPDVKDFIFEV